MILHLMLAIALHWVSIKDYKVHQVLEFGGLVVGQYYQTGPSEFIAQCDGVTEYTPVLVFKDEATAKDYVLACPVSKDQ